MWPMLELTHWYNSLLRWFQIRCIAMILLICILCPKDDVGSDIRSFRDAKKPFWKKAVAAPHSPWLIFKRFHEKIHLLCWEPERFNFQFRVCGRRKRKMGSHSFLTLWKKTKNKGSVSDDGIILPNTPIRHWQKSLRAFHIWRRDTIQNHPKESIE